MTDCQLPRPSPQALFDRLRDMMSAQVLGGAPVIPNSNEWYVTALNYALAEEFYAVAEQAWRERDPRYACCENLARMAADDGIFPRPATAASGYIELTGTAGAQLPPSIEIVAGSSSYRLAAGSALPPVLPASGRVIARVTALTPGPEGNGLAVTSGRLVTPIPGVNSIVSVYGGRFCGGRPAEDCEAFRQRYLARKRFSPRATFEWLRQEVLEWPCATRVCLRACSCCREVGRIEAHVFFDGTFEHGIPPQSVLDELTDWFFGAPQGFGLGIAEWGLTGRFYAAKPVPLDIAISNLPCTSSAQVQLIRERIRGLFATLCPGGTFCRRLIDATIVQILGSACAFEVEMHIGGVALCDDFTPKCDEVLVAGVLTISGGEARG